jgi:hypothetical protein
MKIKVFDGSVRGAPPTSRQVAEVVIERSKGARSITWEAVARGPGLGARHWEEQANERSDAAKTPHKHPRSGLFRFGRKI